MVLPERIRSVLITGNNDVNGRGQRAAETLGQRLAAEERQVRIAIPDTPGTDFNDVLNALAEKPNG